MKAILALLPKEILIQLALDIFLTKLNDNPNGKFLAFIKNPKLIETLNNITEKLKQHVEIQ